MSRTESGVLWFLGVPKSGKSTAATAEAAQIASDLDYPLLALDAERSDDFARWPRARTVRDCAALCFGELRRCAFTPTDEQLGALWLWIAAVGHLVVVVDGAHRFLSSATRSQDKLIELMRTHRHRRTWWLLTTHHLSGDVPQSALACAPELRVFRSQGRTLEVLEREHGVPREVVETLEQRSFLRVRLGFE